MPPPQLIETLKELQFFEEVDEALLGELVPMARIVELPAGKVVFREGEAASRAFVIVEGSVSLEICAPGVGCRRILTVGSGELLGWSPMLEQTRLTATARTLGPTRAVEIDAGQFLTLCEHNPRFGYEIMRRAALALAKRLSATRLQLVDVYGSQMPPALGEEEREA